ncbi:MAG TPA: class I SAM-dependent methyltransferase [Chitinophagaceae bacterium]|jgi:ubiquinone/menaquinone biosynthesis C-methylase UbiE|nr:class I SAM-dependent methyltransferase [Chitinophagaceae bacterium]
MPQKISQRLLEIVNSLPLKNGIRVLEIGCGTGVAARGIANRISKGKVLAIDRSSKAIEQAIKNSQSEITNGKLQFLQAKIEEFELPKDEEPYDFAFAIRVGALDGRHPEIEQEALNKISKALKKNGKLFIDGGNPLKEIRLKKA